MSGQEANRAGEANQCRQKSGCGAALQRGEESCHLVVALVRHRLEHDGLHRRDVCELNLWDVEGADDVGPAYLEKTERGQSSVAVSITMGIAQKSKYRNKKLIIETHELKKKKI